MIRYGENRAHVLDATVTAPPGTRPVTIAIRNLVAANAAEAARFSAAATVTISAGPRSTNELARHEASPATEQVAVRFGTRACSELLEPAALPPAWTIEALELAVVDTGLLFVNTILRIADDDAGGDPLSDWENRTWRVMAAVEGAFPVFALVLRALESRGLIATSRDFPWGTPPALAHHPEIAPHADYMVDSHFFLTAAPPATRERLIERLGKARWTGSVSGFKVTQFWATTIWEAAQERNDAATLFALMDVDSEFLGEIKVVASATSRYTILLMLLSADAGPALEVSGAELRRLVFKYGYMVHKVRESTRLMTEENRRYYEEASSGPQYDTDYEAWRHYEQLVLAAADGRESAEMARREWTIQITVLAVTMIALLAVVMDAYNFLSAGEVLPPVTRERLLVLVALILLLGVAVPLLLRQLGARARERQEGRRLHALLRRGTA